MRERNLIVAQVIKTFGGGGAQRAAVNLARGVADRGGGSRLIAVGALGNFASGVSESVPGDSLGISGIGSVPSGLLSFRRLLRKRQIDVVHVHGSGVLPFVAAAMVGLRRLPQLHFTWHDSSSVLGGGEAKRRLTRWALFRCDSISASSAGVAARLASAWGGGRVFVLRNGVEDRGQIGDPGANLPKVVWAARVVPEKRPEWFVAAAAAARQAGIQGRFVLAGSPLPNNLGYMDAIRGFAAQQSAAVEFPGWVEDSSSLFRSASIGVQTSQTEGLSLSLLEQMMAGLAVVATDVGDTREALDGGRAGILIRPDDEAGLKAAITDLLVDRDRRINLGRAARARAVSLYSCRAMAEQMMPIYEKGTA